MEKPNSWSNQIAGRTKYLEEQKKIEKTKNWREKIAGGNKQLEKLNCWRNQIAGGTKQLEDLKSFGETWKVDMKRQRRENKGEVSKEEEGIF